MRHPIRKKQRRESGVILEKTSGVGTSLVNALKTGLTRAFPL